MATVPDEIDYSAIVNSYIKKSIVTEKLEDSRNILSSKLWETLQDYYKAEENNTIAENANNTMKLLLFETIKIKNQLDRENKIMDQKIEELQSLFANMELKTKQQMDTFFEKMETLYQEFRKLPREFDNDNMTKQIEVYKKYIMEISMMKIEIVRKKSKVSNACLIETEFDHNMKNLNSVRALKEENIDKCVNSVQQQVSSIEQDNTNLEGKINDLIVKYGF